MEKEIYNTMYECLDYLKTIYEEERILGIYAFGNVNYGDIQSIDELNLELIYLPSFEDMCLNPNLINNNIIKYNNIDIKITDFRVVFDYAMHINLISQALYTKYRICNPRYEELFNKYFLNEKDNLIKHHENLRIYKSAEEGLNALQSNDLYNSYRNLLFCDYYVKGFPFDECVNPQDFTHKTLLYNLKYNNIFLQEDTKKDLIKHTKEKLENYLKEYNNKEEYNQYPIEKLKEGIIEIMKVACMTRTVKKQDFINTLSQTEQKALQSIVDNIGEEGYITISKLTEVSGVSRPVYTSLFYKMKDSNFAIVESKGAKGTYIKIIKQFN